MADALLLGRVLWYELLTTDRKAAEKFYATAVGWTVTPFEGSPQPYDVWMRAMKDPQGAAFSIYEPASLPQQPESDPQTGGVSWHELYTTGADAAMKFYTELFGWRPTESMDLGPMGKYHEFGRAFPLGGMMNKPAAMAQAPPHWSFYFRVPDVHAGAERVKANGGQVLNGPMEAPGGDWIVNCMDPQGAAFSLHHKK